MPTDKVKIEVSQDVWDLATPEQRRSLVVRPEERAEYGTPTVKNKLTVRNHEEDDLQTRCIQAAQYFGWTVCHFRPAKTDKGWRTAIQGTKGFYDAVMMRETPSHMTDILFVEFKSEKGKLSMEQTLWKMLAENSLAEYWLVRPSNEPDFIKRLR